MTHLQIRREAGVWAVLLDGQDIKSGIAGLSLETDQHRPQDPPTVVIRYRPDRLDVDIDAAELVEVPHEHDWLEVTDFKDHSQNERHYVCDGCPKQRSVREVIQAGESE